MWCRHSRWYMTTNYKQTHGCEPSEHTALRGAGCIWLTWLVPKCVCVYVSIYVCMYVCIYVCGFVCLKKYVHALYTRHHLEYICIHAHIHTTIHTYIPPDASQTHRATAWLRHRGRASACPQLRISVMKGVFGYVHPCKRACTWLRRGTSRSWYFYQYLSMPSVMATFDL